MRNITPQKRLSVVAFAATAIMALTVSASAETTADLPVADPLVVGTKEAPPFAMRDAEGRWHGVSIELWDHVARELGRPYEYRELPLEGMLQAVADGEVDVALAALSVTAEREALVDFSQPYYQSGFAVAVRAEELSLLSMVSGVLSGTFLRAAGLLFVLLSAVGALIWLAERRGNAEEFGGGIEGVGSGFWWSAVTMTTVGYGDKSPRTLIGRLIGLVWMFTSIIIIASITGAMASAFTVQSLSSNIQSLDDLVRTRTGTVADSTATAYLRDAGGRSVEYEALPEALAALEAGLVEAVVHDHPVLVHRIREADANLAVLPLRFGSEYYAIALREGSTMAEEIDRTLLRFTASPPWAAIQRRFGLGSP